MVVIDLFFFFAVFRPCVGIGFANGWFDLIACFFDKVCFLWWLLDQERRFS